MEKEVPGDQASLETLEPVREGHGTTLRTGLMFAMRYQLDARLGAGGAGTLFRAFDTVLRRQVALKILHRHREDAPTESAARILREARAAAALNHPNIVAIHDVDEHEGVPFISMEYVEGESLRAFVGKPEPGFETRLKWVVDVARALAAAHEKGIIHRDIKPDNVMLREDGVIKVLDFGIARLMAEHRHDDLGDRVLPLQDGQESASGSPPPGMTAESQDANPSGNAAFVRVAGTPGYVSPEQIRGEPIDARVDQFGWAVMAYELFSGHTPWGADRHSWMVSTLSTNATPLTDVPENVARAIARSLEKRRENRYASLQELIAELTSADASLVSGGGHRFRRIFSSSFARAVAALVILAICILGVRKLAARATHVSPSSATTPPAAASTLLTTLSTSPNCNKEATKYYKTGLVALHDNTFERAHEAFNQAITADPGCPDAHLQALMTGYLFETIDQVRTRLHNALSLRDGLDARGQALLDAYASFLLSDKADHQELAERLDAVAARFPLDAQILEITANAFLRAAGDVSSVEHVLDLTGRATEIDPKYADAWQMRARALVYLGRREEALAAIARCIEISPGSADCMSERIRTLRPIGQCSAVVDDTRRWIADVPTSFYAHLELANALASIGAPKETIESALSTRSSGSELGNRGEFLNIYYRSLLNVLDGNLVEAKKFAERLVQHTEGASALFDHVRALWLMTELLIETGEQERAGALAKEYFRRRDAWTEGFWATSEYEPVLSSVLLHQRKLSLDAWRSTMDHWEERAQVHRTKRQLWAFRWGPLFDGPITGAQTLAQEAWHNLPDEIPTAARSGQQFYYPALTDMLQGHIALAAGETAKAIELLEPATKSCDRLQIPFAHIRGHLWLGQAKERAGDIAGACEAYAYVLQYWGNAKPRSVTAEEAKGRVQALHCKM